MSGPDSTTTASPAGPGAYLSPLSSPPIEDLVLDGFLQGYVAGLLGMPGHMVRPRLQLVPPAQPDQTADWCAIGVVDENNQPLSGIPVIVHKDASDDLSGGTDQMQEVDELNVLASFYGPSARGNARALRSALSLPQNREELAFQQLRLCSIPDRIIALPAIVNGRSARRYDISFTLRRITVSTWPIQTLTAPKGTIKTDGDSGVSVPIVVSNG